MNGRTEYSFISEIYREYMGRLSENELPYIPFFGYPHDYHSSETARLSSYDVINGTVPKELFADSIALIGTYSEGTTDSCYTVISHNTPMYGVGVHANTLQALLNENLKKGPRWLAVLVIAFILFVAAFLTWSFREFWLVSGASLTLILGYRFFVVWTYEQGLVMPLPYPTAAILLCYIFGIGCQYIQERPEKQYAEVMFRRYMSKAVVNEILKDGRSTL